MFKHNTLPAEGATLSLMEAMFCELAMEAWKQEYCQILSELSLFRFCRKTIIIVVKTKNMIMKFSLFTIFRIGVATNYNELRHVNYDEL